MQNKAQGNDKKSVQYSDYFQGHAGSYTQTTPSKKSFTLHWKY